MGNTLRGLNVRAFLFAAGLGLVASAAQAQEVVPYGSRVGMEATVTGKEGTERL